MQNNTELTREQQQRSPFAEVRRSSQRRARQRFGLLLCAGMLIALALLLSACTPLSSKPCETPVLPTRPVLIESLPLETYSSRVRSDTEAWAKRVTGTLATSKP